MWKKHLKKLVLTVTIVSLGLFSLGCEDRDRVSPPAPRESEQWTPEERQENIESEQENVTPPAEQEAEQEDDTQNEIQF